MRGTIGGEKGKKRKEGYAPYSEIFTFIKIQKKERTMKYDRIIAIDPDARDSGVAQVDIQTKGIATFKMTFAEVISYLTEIRKLAVKERWGYKVVIEAGWLNESNWHITGKYMSARKAAAIGRSVGMNHQTGVLLYETCKQYLGCDTELQKPLKKYWKGKDGKITQEEITEVTGKEKLPRMNQDQRDALLIAWVHAGLPIRIKPKKTP